MIYKGVEDLLSRLIARGRWHNNTTELWDHYENNKILYLKNNSKFNICPENINTKDYVTEKLFEAFAADTIPVYYGSDNSNGKEFKRMLLFFGRIMEIIRKPGNCWCVSKQMKYFIKPL